MEQVGMNGVQQVSYVAPSAASEPSFTSAMPPEQKEDGDKKLIGALMGLAAITIGGIAIARDLKKGDASSLRKIFNKSGKEVAQATNKGIKAGSKQAIDNSKKIVKNVSTEAQENINKLTNNVSDLISKQKTYDELQTKINLGEKAISIAEKTGKTTVVFDGKEMKLSRAKGLLSNAKGEFKKLSKVTDDDIQKAIASAKQAASTPEGSGIINMQRAARKNPGLSQESLAKIATTTTTETASEASMLAQKYDKYISMMKNKNKTPMSFETFIQKQAKLKS